MTYVIEWRDQEAEVTTGTEAVAVLERIAAEARGAYLMHVAPADDNEPSIELVYGRHERAMLMYADATFGGWAYDPTLLPAPTDLDYDYGSVEPDRTRLTAAQARSAVAHFVDTGTRPNGLSWLGRENLTDAPSPAEDGWPD